MWTWAALRGQASVAIVGHEHDRPGLSDYAFAPVIPTRLGKDAAQLVTSDAGHLADVLS